MSRSGISLESKSLPSANLSGLPDALQRNIGTYLSIQETSAFSDTNKTLKKSLQDSWRKKLECHFPHIFDQLKTKENIDWHAEFRNAYKSEYKDLSPKLRKLFTLVKEGNLNRLKKEKLTQDELIYLFYQDNIFESLIQWAAKKNHQAILDYFYGIAKTHYYVGDVVDVNKRDKWNGTILHWAVLCVQPVDTLNLLIQQGADIDAVIAPGLATPLYIAGYIGHLEAAQALLAKNANVNAARNQNDTALFIAAQKGHLGIVLALLAKNADVNKVHSSGSTALYMAAKWGHPEIVKALLDKGANINQARRNGIRGIFITETALHMAATRGHRSIVQTIKTHELNNYLIKTNARLDNDYKTYSIFGVTFNLSMFGKGCSAREKKDAAAALKNVIEGTANKSCLAAHQKALGHGELGVIYRGLRI